MKDFFVGPNISVKEAMKRMNEAGEKALFVTDVDGRLLGSLTDGDIRRWILKEGSLNDSIEKIYNKQPFFVRQDLSREGIKSLLLDKKIEAVPVVDNVGIVKDILFWEGVFGSGAFVPKNTLDIPVVIMAGGRGTRLDPFTRILPKPLIPIGNKAVIDVIMDKFGHFGVRKFYISISHKSKMIKSYFEEMDPDYSVDFIEEERPLGTAGSLRFLRGKIKGSILVTNCDIVIDCDYAEIADFHETNKYDATIVGSFRHFVIPYGICEIEKGGLLTAIREKPEYDFLVNTGMCVLKKDTLDLIPEGREFHMTDLLTRIKETGGRVGVFPISEKSWMDVGQWEEYRKSARLLGMNEAEDSEI